MAEQTHQETRARRGGRARADRATAPDQAVRRVAVVFNPASAGDRAERRRRELLDALTAAGVDPLIEETTPEDPGQGITRRALERGVDLVLAAGGDGTVMACATALAGGDVPLAVLPTGTGNLLAVNLGLPDDPRQVLEVALHGARRRLDVGAIGPDRFVVMSGIGFDAAMLRDADPALKARIGAVAYVLSGLRQLRRPPTEFRIGLDGLPPVSRTGQGVLVGNFGKLQGGLEVLPGAEPDDGLLDVGVLQTGTIGGWLRLAARVMLGRGSRLDGPPLELLRARRIEIECRRPQPIERDGEPGPSTRHLTVETLPHALTLCVPAPDWEPGGPEEAGPG
jgi:YegS/Rv2252/BmrU family lipid kinase